MLPQGRGLRPSRRSRSPRHEALFQRGWVIGTSHIKNASVSISEVALDGSGKTNTTTTPNGATVSSVKANAPTNPSHKHLVTHTPPNNPNIVGILCADSALLRRGRAAHTNSSQRPELRRAQELLQCRRERGGRPDASAAGRRLRPGDQRSFQARETAEYGRLGTPAESESGLPAPAAIETYSSR